MSLVIFGLCGMSQDSPSELRHWLPQLSCKIATTPSSGNCPQLMELPHGIHDHPSPSSTRDRPYPVEQKAEPLSQFTRTIKGHPMHWLRLVTVHFPPSNPASFTKYSQVHSNNLHTNHPWQYLTTYYCYIDHFVCMPQHTPRTSEWLWKINKEIHGILFLGWPL